MKALYQFPSTISWSVDERFDFYNRTKHCQLTILLLDDLELWVIFFRDLRDMAKLWNKAVPELDRIALNRFVENGWWYLVWNCIKISHIQLWKIFIDVENFLSMQSKNIQMSSTYESVILLSNYSKRSLVLIFLDLKSNEYLFWVSIKSFLFISFVRSIIQMRPWEGLNFQTKQKNQS